MRVLLECTDFVSSFFMDGSALFGIDSTNGNIALGSSSVCVDMSIISTYSMDLSYLLECISFFKLGIDLVKILHFF